MSGYYYNWRDYRNQTNDPSIPHGILPRGPGVAKLYLNGKPFDEARVYFIQTGEDGRIERYKQGENGDKYLIDTENMIAVTECVFGLVAVEFCEQPKQYSEPRG